MEVLCVYAEVKYGFVSIDDRGFKCSTCNFNCHDCCHIKLIMARIDKDDGDLPDAVYTMLSMQKDRRIDPQTIMSF